MVMHINKLINHPRYHLFFFFNDTATTEIYTLSLHDALPIYTKSHRPPVVLYRSVPETAARKDRARSSASSPFPRSRGSTRTVRSEEHTSELQSQSNLVCRLLLEKKKTTSDQ